jgi:hypothetical protein
MEESVPDLPQTGEDALAEPETTKPRSTRKRATADDSKPRRARKTAAAAGDAGEKPATKRGARKSRSKTATE